jgi:hypothetical protein
MYLEGEPKALWFLELKPQSPLCVGTRAEDIVWTTPRDRVPSLLEGRVCLKVWQATFDAVFAQREFMLKTWESILWNYLPCCSCICRHAGRKENEEGWNSLLEEQAEIYQPLGLDVSLAKGVKDREPTGLQFALTSTEAASLDMDMPTGDDILVDSLELHPIELADYYRPEHAYAPHVSLTKGIKGIKAPEPLSFAVVKNVRRGVMMPTGDDYLVDNLENLMLLHQTGALNNSEFAVAKAMLLGQ